MPRRPLPVILAAAALLAACSSSLTDGGGGGTPPPPTNRFTELANSLEDAAESELPTLTTLSQPGLPFSFPATPGCPAVSSTADQDADGILDDATFSFTNPPCSITGFFGGTLTLTGTVRVQDSSLTSDSAYAVTLNDLTWTFVDTAGTLSYTAVRNGQLSRTGSDSTITLAVTDTVKRSRPQITAIATIAKELVWSFVADTPGTILVDQPLPHGNITVGGNWHWKRSTEDWTLAVATPTPLVYDPTCTTTAQRIKSGQVTMTGTIAGVSGTLQINWSACGKLPTRTFVTP